jgi:hypothetical protein
MNNVPHIFIPFGMSHTDELLAFVSATRNQYRQSPIIYSFREHGIEWVARRIDESVVLTRVDNRVDGTRVWLFDNREQFRGWLKDHDPAGSYDIENGGAPFGYQRDPASAQAQAAAVNPLEGVVFMVTTEYADEPTCNTEHCYLDQLPTGYEYLAPILTAPEFARLQFTVDLTRVTIVKSA